MDFEARRLSEKVFYLLLVLDEDFRPQTRSSKKGITLQQDYVFIRSSSVCSIASPQVISIITRVNDRYKLSQFSNIINRLEHERANVSSQTQTRTRREERGGAHLDKLIPVTTSQYPRLSLNTSRAQPRQHWQQTRQPCLFLRNIFKPRSSSIIVRCSRCSKRRLELRDRMC